MTRWFALGLWYTAIMFTSSLASVPVTNQPLSDYLISKAGHVAEYGLLGWITFEALTAPAAGLALGPRLALAATILLGLALATVDEVRQSFVYGRGSSPIDVLIDMVGVSGGTLLHPWLNGWSSTPSPDQTPGEPGQ